jgi:hypothetical protein
MLFLFNLNLFFFLYVSYTTELTLLNASTNQLFFFFGTGV